jgi:phasin family protein
MSLQRFKGLTGEVAMMKNMDDMQKLGKDNMDATMRSFGAVSKGVQAIAVEVADYSKKSFEESSAAMEKMMGAKSIDKAIEVQSDYVKSAYEAFVAQAAKLGELYADLAKETYKPFESYLAKVSITK